MYQYAKGLEGKLKCGCVRFLEEGPLDDFMFMVIKLFMQSIKHVTAHPFKDTETF